MSSASMSSNSSSDMASFDEGGDLFFSDPFPFPFFSPTDVVHQIPDNETYQQHKLDEFSSSLDPFSSYFFSFSPPSTHLENLSLYQQHLSSTATNLGAEFGNVSVKSEDLQMGADYNGNQNFVPPSYNGSENLSLYQQHLSSTATNLGAEFGNVSVKSEDLQMGADYNGNQNFVPPSYNGSENAHKSIQRSYSSNCFDGKPGFLFQSHYDTLIDSSNFQGQTVNSPENDQVIRVCSTGDLQNMDSTQTNHREGSFLEEANFKVRRYSAEEKKERISRYKAKRGQRNFNRTIKYACRKTLADNRPRIRGRFARNDETGENSRVSCSTRNEEDDEYWFESDDVENERRTILEQFWRSSFPIP